MKKFLLIVLSAFLTAGAYAQHKVCIKFKDGTKTIVTDATNIESITFDPENSDMVQFTTSVGKVTYNSAQVSVDLSGDVANTSKIGVKYATTKEALADADCQKREIEGTYNNMDFTLSGLAINTTYYCVAYVEYSNEELTSDVFSFTTAATKYPVADAVDLGLSVKWASWNLGATSVSDLGFYFGWGNTDDSHYHANIPEGSVGQTFNYAGDERYDAATKQWGKGWATPTKEQFLELNTLNWTYSDSYIGSGQAGWVLTASNGNSIFVPSGGFKNESGLRYPDSWYYWTSDLSYTQQYGQEAHYMDFNSEQSILDASAEPFGIYMPVRPVYKEEKIDDTSGESSEAGKAVDLGLSVRWADRNIGATVPSDYGDYFAWGETESKSRYGIDNYKYRNEDIGDQIWGTEYDAAHVNWKGTWRMPSKDEVNELIDNCNWAWTYKNTIPGYEVTSKKDSSKSIFLPATGYKYDTNTGDQGVKGYYWSGYLFVQRPDKEFAQDIEFGMEEYGLTYNTRAYGLTIRPVKP